MTYPYLEILEVRERVIRHCFGSNSGKRVVVEIDVPHGRVFGKGLGQGGDTRVVNAILRHLDFFKSSDPTKGLRKSDST